MPSLRPPSPEASCRSLPTLRLCLLSLLFITWSAGDARAQVVIQESVEIDERSEQVVADGPGQLSRVPYQDRILDIDGRRDYVFYGYKARTIRASLGGTLTAVTTLGSETSTELSGRIAYDVTEDTPYRCTDQSTGDYTAYPINWYREDDVELLRLTLDPFEKVDSLRFSYESGDSRTIRVSSNPYDQNGGFGVRVGCAYTGVSYYDGDCPCLSAPDAFSSIVYGYWVYEAEPPDYLRVELPSDTLAAGDSVVVDVHALYSDGVLAAVPRKHQVMVTSDVGSFGWLQKFKNTPPADTVWSEYYGVHDGAAHVKLVLRGDVPTENETITVRAEYAGAVGEKRITLLGEGGGSDYRFAVTVSHDSLYVTEASTVTLSPRDAAGIPVTIPASTPVLLSAPSPHGRLAQVVGADTTDIDPAVATPYGTLAANEIVFVANGGWPSSTAAVAVHAEEEGKPQTAGVAAISVLAPNLDLVLSVDPSLYLPEKDQTFTVTARLENLPSAEGADVRFELTQAHEFEWASGGTSPQDVPVVGGEAKLDLLSKTYWGVATVKVSFASGGNLLERDQQVPIDTDGDTIADSWELDSANGGTLALGGSTADGGYDAELPSKSFPGDRLTKLMEYQGVSYGGAYMRTEPDDERDMFLNIANAPQSGTFAMNGMSLLDIHPNNTGTATPIHAATNDNLGASLLELPRVNSPAEDALFFVLGVTQPGKSPQLSLGDTKQIPKFGRGVSYVYLQTIDNLFNGNSYPESRGSAACPEIIEYKVATSAGVATWVAVFDGSDLNNNGSNTDMVNPFDLLAPGVRSPLLTSPTCGHSDRYLASANDPIDNRIATVTQPEATRRTGRHELGHIVGLKHPGSGSTVMRQGVGPAKVDGFSTQEIQDAQVNK